MPSPERKETRRRVEERVRRFDRACTAVRIPWRHRLMYWIHYVALARRGVLVHSATHDAVYQDGFLKRRYDAYSHKINRRLMRAEPPRDVVEVMSFESGELEIEELQLLMRRNVPFVIRNGARAGVRDWTLEYLEEVAGTCPVPINAAEDRPSEDTSRPTKAHHYYDFRTGTLAEVAASIRSGGNLRVSTAEDVMHHDEGRLLADLDTPYWEQVSGWDRNQHHWWRSRMMAGKVVSHQLMVQPPNALTLWHTEPGDNFFVLVRGTKTWTLANPYYTAALRPRVKTSTNYHGSNIDVRESDAVLTQRGYAGYLNIPKVQVVMRPGDVLRVPNYWWHTVVTHPGDYTVAATIRANTLPNRLGPGYTLLRWLDPQYLAIARDYAREGRIHDRHIGFPRPPRAADGTAAEPAASVAPRAQDAAAD